MVRMLALLVLLTAGATVPAAAACYGPLQIRQMVSQGQIVELSTVIGEIRSVGQPVAVPRLCDDGGSLAYEVDVVSNGSVVHLRVDAHTGQISR
jgi:hypothetical protein